MDPPRRLAPEALFIWGDRDRLVPAAFSRHVADVLPHARQVVLKECGHVPGWMPERANGLIRDQVTRQSAVPSKRGSGRNRSTSAA